MMDSSFEALRDWLFLKALPLWSTVGTDWIRGGFYEKIAPEGRPSDEPRRARVTGRQIYSFATAERLGWNGPGKKLVEHGLSYLERFHITADGFVIPLVSSEGHPLSSGFDLYDQAFVIFGLAAAAQIGVRKDFAEELAVRLRVQMMKAYKHPQNGFEEGNPRITPLRANPHMHLLEASLAWVEAGGDHEWQSLADEIAELCLKKFIAPDTGALHEYFDGTWERFSDPVHSVVEPGHQAEWAWLLIRWGLTRRRDDALTAAKRLLTILDSFGISKSQNLVVNELNADFTIRDPLLRLWPQTERIKASIALRWLAQGQVELKFCNSRISENNRQLLRYMDHPVLGSWWEHLDVNGRAVSEPARASSLYHITCAFSELSKSQL